MVRGPAVDLLVRRWDGGTHRTARDGDQGTRTRTTTSRHGIVVGPCVLRRVGERTGPGRAAGERPGLGRSARGLPPAGAAGRDGTPRPVAAARRVLGRTGRGRPAVVDAHQPAVAARYAGRAH